MGLTETSCKSTSRSTPSSRGTPSVATTSRTPAKRSTWGWSKDETLLTLQGNGECFVAKLERGEDGSKPRWLVYWDPENEMLDNLGADECKPVKLRRRMLLGMDSKYVRD